MDFKYQEGRIFIEDNKKQLMAEVCYSVKENGEVVIERTYVNPVLRGQGVAAKIMQATADYLREHSLKATATCSYAHSWLRKNKQLYSDIISKDLASTKVACSLSNNR